EEAPAEAFETRAGRVVYQQNGIAPDVALENPPPGRMEVALLRENHFFTFANRYAAEKDEMPRPGRDDAEVLAAFTQYLENEEFSFESEAERLFDRLRAELSDSSDTAGPAALDALQAEIQVQKEALMREQESMLLLRIYNELSRRFPSDIPRAKLRLQTDTEVEQALDLLYDERRYQELLQP
ncbi:MAG: hypothetical protein ACOC2C_06135, partial [Cyclonatronaceae bacterium]